MKKATLVSVFLILFIGVFQVKAQIPTSILDVQFTVIEQNSELDEIMIMDESVVEMDPTILNDPAMQDNPEIIEYKTEQLINQNRDMKNISLIIIISDTLALNKLHYQIGRTLGSENIASGYINFNTLQQDSKISYYRTLNQITINLGFYENVDNIFGVFYLENLQGVTSPFVNKENHL